MTVCKWMITVVENPCISTFEYGVAEVAPYIDWTYFFHAWGIRARFANVSQLHACKACEPSWLSSFPESDKAQALEALRLFKEAQGLLQELNGCLVARGRYRLCQANADGDDLWLDGVCLPLLRQQTSPGEHGPYLCLSDFVRPRSMGMPDVVGVFAVTVSGLDVDGGVDPYRKLLMQTLSDRLVEAAAEKMHQYVRREAWGYAPQESLSVAQLHAAKFQGIRPAVGYPSLPDQSVNFILDQLLDMCQIGISLTENGAMSPHASVSGLMLSHPAARYFAVGHIGQDQLEDYAHRRGLPLSVMRKFLAANL